MWEDKYDVYEDLMDNGKIVRRLAADMDLEHALLFMRAYMETYYHDLSFSLILKHATREEPVPNEV